MKVFYTCSRSLPTKYKTIQIETLKAVGYTVYTRCRPKDYSHVTQKEAREVVNENISLIKKADVVVADVSFASSSIGYHISIGLNEKKPILILHNYKELRELSNIPTNLLGMPSKYLIFKAYTFDTLLTVLKSSVAEIKDLLHTKFNFLVPPEISNYMEWQSRYKNRPKSELVREALEEKMNKDNEYLDYVLHKNLDKLS